MIMMWPQQQQQLASKQHKNPNSYHIERLDSAFMNVLVALFDSLLL